MTGPPPPPSPQVLLLGYPVALGARQEEHTQEVLREFALMAAADADGRLAGTVPGRLLAMVRHLSGTYAREIDEPAQARARAADAGLHRVDLAYPVLPETRELVEEWAALMAEVDAYCREGHLLALATPPDLAALRDWVIGQFRDQLDGRPAARWDGPVA